MTRWLIDRYDRRSLLAFALLIVVGGLVGYRWSDLLDANSDLDALLCVTWALLAALLVWDVTPRRDLALIAVGAAGGAVIEWWGTTTRLWTYFTAERPPLWILPAWPIAALAIDRLARILDHALGARVSERAFARAYWTVVPAFVAWMTWFARPSWQIASTRVVVLLMLGLTFGGKTPRRDVLTFAAGSLLGVLLEYWGTSRQCWTYYTREVPPPVAIVAHGFAAIAFCRGAGALLGADLGKRRLSSRSEAPPSAA